LPNFIYTVLSAYSMEENKGGAEAQNPKPTQEKPVFRVWDGLALVAYITSFIVGPLIILGGLGLWIDIKFGGRKIVFFIFIALAFVVSNLLVVRKSKEIISRYK
jgi:hypothetical protein